MKQEQKQIELPLPYYDLMTKSLKGSILSKAKTLYKKGCIKCINRDTWKCKPIYGYNKTTYTITKTDKWRCNCQYHTKTGALCSHINAVLISLKVQK